MGRAYTGTSKGSSTIGTVYDEGAAVRQVEAALQVWVDTVNAGITEDILKLYDDAAILLPTLSSQARKTNEERKDYFDFFTSRQSLKGFLTEAHIQTFGTSAIASGFYTFTFIDNGKTVEVPARFTFVYKRAAEGWLIVNHHSSQLPTN